ncbi:MAG: valine--pyruvate transaminase [Spirochaetaceae bacterium]|nr:valine--pyruvate transaminase [Spirochaetaceae bacterium]
MDDLGRAMDSGNPAHIPEVNEIWRRRSAEILANGAELEETLANYDTPQGKHAFLDSLAGLLNREFGWNLNAKNIAVTNGSQMAFFLLLNLLSGTDTDGSKNRVLFPLCPEYIGYADQTIEDGMLITRPAKIELTRPGFFKYNVDFENIDVSSDISALCISRPTNPTGNVLTDQEVARLAGIAGEKDIPFIIDNAYGAPFPNILFRDMKPYWDKHVILSMSLSKLGLPSVRTGIVVADESIIEAVSACNAVISLSNGSLGQVLVRPLIESGDILRLSNEVIRPFYEDRSIAAVTALQEAFGDDIPYRIHESEGSIFLWLWLDELHISSTELYERLKARAVLVVSGHYFFYGLDRPWTHADECLRLSYAQDTVKFREAATIMDDGK